jgi:hypothetical protein
MPGWLDVKKPDEFAIIQKLFGLTASAPLVGPINLRIVLVAYAKL